jgi:DNA-binding transcriptional regulator YiaG
MTNLTPKEFKRRRQALGLSRAALGRELGVTQMTVYRWETGQSPIADTAQLLFARIWEEQRSTP